MISWSRRTSACLYNCSSFASGLKVPCLVIDRSQFTFRALGTWRLRAARASVPLYSSGYRTSSSVVFLSLRDLLTWLMLARTSGWSLTLNLAGFVGTVSVVVLYPAFFHASSPPSSRLVLLWP